MKQNQVEKRPSLYKPAIYEITIYAILDSQWATRFDRLTLTSNKTNGTTTLKGIIVDQTALHSHLQTIRDLNLFLLSVTYCGPAPK